MGRIWTRPLNPLCRVGSAVSESQAVQAVRKGLGERINQELKRPAFKSAKSRKNRSSEAGVTALLQSVRKVSPSMTSVELVSKTRSERESSSESHSEFQTTKPVRSAATRWC